MPLLAAALLISCAQGFQERQPAAMQIAASIYYMKSTEFKALGSEIQFTRQGATSVLVVTGLDKQFQARMDTIVYAREAQLLSAPVIRTLENMPATIKTSLGGAERFLSLTPAIRGTRASLAIAGVEPVPGEDAISFSTRAMVPMGKPSAMMVKRG